MGNVVNGNNFIERSIEGALSFFKESVFADEYASRRGLLQSLNPAIKTVTLLLFIIQILFTKSIPVLLCLYAFCLVLTGLSKISIGFFLKRTWIFIPLFSLFIAIPSLFSFFTPGEALITFKTGWGDIIITRQGASGAGLFIARVVTSVSFAVLLSITTRHFALLKVLRVFKVPPIFVTTLGMCYRYIFLFVDIIGNTYLALKSRTGTRIHYAKGQNLVAWNMAFLWQRSVHMQEQVYNAMLSRGYSGEPRVIDESRIHIRDWAWFILILIMSFLVIWIR